MGKGDNSKKNDKKNKKVKKEVKKPDAKKYHALNTAEGCLRSPHFDRNAGSSCF